jgi:hypothetical protein
VSGRIIDADRDAIANIDRLTAQVETLKRERDEHYRKLCNYWTTFGGCSDSAGEHWVKQREARIQILEQERDAARTAADVQAAEVARLNIVLAKETERAVKAEGANFTANYRAAKAKTRAHVLEGVLRKVEDISDRCKWGFMSDDRGLVDGIVKDALTTASPSTGAELAAKHGFQRLSDEAFKQNVERECARVAPPAERCHCAPPNLTPGSRLCINCKCLVAPPADTPAPTCNCAPGQPKHCCVHFPSNCDEECASPAGSPTSAGAQCPHDEGSPREDCFECLRADLANLREQVRVNKLLQETVTRDRDATTAKLGRAVAALRVARPCVNSMGHHGSLIEIDASLADDESREAGEAWAEMVAAIEKARALDKSLQVKHWGYDGGESYSQEHDDLRKALAKVDARRGGGR